MKQFTILFTAIVCFTLSISSQDLTGFRNSKGLWGFKDKKGKVIIEAKYAYKPTAFVEGRSIYNKTYSLNGVLDEKGKEITPPVYSSIKDFKYGFAYVTKEIVDTTKKVAGKPTKILLKGIIDRNGKEVVPVIYKEVFGSLDNGLFVKVADTANKIFYYNTAGKIIQVPEGLQLENNRVDGKRIIAKKNGKYGLVDGKFNEVLPFEYSLIAPSENGILIIGQNYLYGLMDQKLNWIIKPTYKYISFFVNGYAVVSDKDNLQGAINTKGNLTAPPQFSSLSLVDKAGPGLAIYRQKGSDRSGLVNVATGKIITPANYILYSSDYTDGVFVFRRDGKKGMVDTTGKEIFYDAYTDFSPGFGYHRAWVMKNNKYGFIDNTGKLVIPLQYDMIGGFVEGLAKVRVNGKNGFINPKGELVIPMIYKDAQNFDGGVAWVKDENDRAFYIDLEGKEVK